MRAWIDYATPAVNSSGELGRIVSNQIKSLFESGKSPYTQTHTGSSVEKQGSPRSNNITVTLLNFV